MNRIIIITALGLWWTGLAGAAETPTAPPSPPAAPAPAGVPMPETPQPADEAQMALMAEKAVAQEEALKAAEVSQREALKAVEAARQQLDVQAREMEKARLERDRARGDARAERDLLKAQAREARARQQAIERELESAHESLRRATRDVARVHRDINVYRPGTPVAPGAPGYAVRVVTGDKPVIGVVLGGPEDQGVPVLGVSPDGPADRAGIQQGDLIVAVMGQPLAGGEQDTRAVLSEALKDIKVGDELNIGVLREGKNQDFTVVVAKREPYTWHGLSRLATAPVAVADGEMLVERIELPEIDPEQLQGELAVLREQMDVLRATPGTRVLSFSDGGTQEFEFEFEEFSDFGDTVLSGTNAWFGMPLTSGIKMAELDAELGDYFDSDSGVLVLKADPDNRLQLRSGDVILKVGGSAVATPSDVVRALRDVESGSELAIDIKRERKNRTLKVEVPETTRVGFLLGDGPALLTAPPASPAPAPE